MGPWDMDVHADTERWSSAVLRLPAIRALSLLYPAPPATASEKDAGLRRWGVPGEGEQSIPRHMSLLPPDDTPSPEAVPSSNALGGLPLLLQLVPAPATGAPAGVSTQGRHPLAVPSGVPTDQGEAAKGPPPGVPTPA